MANTTTRLELRTRAKLRADMENTAFVSDSEWNHYINQGNSELYDLIVTVYEDYFVTKAPTFTDDRADGIYTVSDVITANNVYKILGVDMGVNGSTVRLKKFSFAERNMYDSNIATLYGFENHRWHYQGATIRIIPANASNNVITVWYIPETPLLENDTGVGGTVEAVYNRGWEEYIVIYAARKALLKEESNTNKLDDELLMLGATIQAFAANREAGESSRIVDVTRGTLSDKSHLRY
jgi:hypothetical protein